MMLRQSLIPKKHIFYNKLSGNIMDLNEIHGSGLTMNWEAICVFAAIGCFIADDTYFKNIQICKPGFSYDINEQGKILSKTRYFEWHYSPRDISRKQCCEEFSHLFEEIVNRQTMGKNVLLALSGGLDSRAQAAALIGRDDVYSYTYKFQGGVDETKYGREISNQAGFKFKSLTVPKGYLWDVIEQLAQINSCYSEFTHPRQMAFFKSFEGMGDTFSTGHWGWGNTVFGHEVGQLDNLNFDDQITVLINKMLIKGGLELADSLWDVFGLQGSFTSYFRNRIAELLVDIKIDDLDARTRAFECLYLYRRTMVNINCFRSIYPVQLPFLDDDLWKFTCTIPMTFFVERNIIIDYIKDKAPSLAKIPWQRHTPYNLFNYRHFYSFRNLPRRCAKRLERAYQTYYKNKPLVLRNWELQFLGTENDRELRKWLFENETFRCFIPRELTKTFYNNFKQGDRVWYSHPLSTLLTISLFTRLNKAT